MNEVDSEITFKDFVDPENDIAKDEFGHGTLMFHLIKKCSPSTEIMVGRIARSTRDLQHCKDKISKVGQTYLSRGGATDRISRLQAILWAGKDAQADIISMSFGLPADDVEISGAIADVEQYRGRRVIFLASAGNRVDEIESFPARHSSVISVRATSHEGEFLPCAQSTSPNVLGTYGVTGSDKVPSEFRFTSVCMPGSSVSTAVMSAISAMLLQYAQAFPSILKDCQPDSLQTLWTTHGMEAALGSLSPKVDGPKAVLPSWFFKTYKDHHRRYCAIVSALARVS